MGNDQIINQLIADGQLTDAIKMLTQFIEQEVKEDNTDELSRMYFTRGKLYWRMGQRSAATTDYAHAAQLNPDSPAATALQQAQDIAEFYNHDLYNP
ncbi:MAG: hypothetical protein K2K92_04610 [Duncaniella sp.]|nr:hypothetical protein [Duncaniella sp.]